MAPSVSTSTGATSPRPRSTTAGWCAARASTFPTGLVRDGEVTDPGALGQQIKQFASTAGLPKSVRIGVANQQIVVRVVELPRIDDDKQRDQAVRFQASEAIAMPLNEAVLDHQIAGYADAPDGTPRMQVVLVAARRKMVETLVEAVKAAGLKAEGIDLDAFALVRALAGKRPRRPGRRDRVLPPRWRDQPGQSRSGPSCFFTRPLSAVWDDEDAGSRLADEIRLSIDYYMTQPQARPVGEVVLSGPGSADDGLVEGPGPAPGHPVEVAAPLGQIDSSGLRPARTRTATPSPRDCRSERWHEGRQSPAAGGAAPTGRRAAGKSRLHRLRGAGAAAPMWPRTSSPPTRRRAHEPGRRRRRRGRPPGGRSSPHRPATRASPTSPSSGSPPWRAWPRRASTGSG